MIKTFKTKEDFNTWNKDLPSGVICFIEDTNEVIFRTNNINGEDAIYEGSSAKNAELLELLETGTQLPKQLTKYDVVTYKGRAFKANLYTAFCLPFDVSEEELIEVFGEDFILRDLSIHYEIDETNKHFLMRYYTESKGVHNKLEAFKPYLLKPSKEISADEGLIFYNKIVNPNKERFERKIGNVSRFVCTTDLSELPTGATYITGSGNYSYRSGAPTTIKGWRALFLPTEEGFNNYFNQGWRILE